MKTGLHNPPECQGCDQHMSATTTPGGGIVGWYCTACKRFRPEYDITINNDPANDEK